MKSLKRLFGRKTTRKANSRRLPFRISRPIGYASHVERLEDRTLLASNILASLESSVNNPNDTTELVLNIGAGSSPTLGFEVRASASSSFNPAAIQILDANTNAVIPLNLAENDHQGPNSLVLATLNPGEYKILVQGQTPDTGGFIIDVFLPGDMDGSGTVSQSELEHATAAYYQSNFGYNHFTAQLIQQLGLNPSANYYSEELDGDKDGDIDNHDLQMVTGNQGLPPIQLELIGDQDAPAVDAGLEVDSGISDSDGVSNELTILGTVTDESLITQFKVALDGGSFVDIFGELSGGANGGTFTLTRGWLETNLNSGASLEGGMHTLHFMTADEHGNLSSAGMFDVNFELDTVAPSVTGTPIGDQNLNEDFTPVNLGALSTYFNQNGGTPLNFHVDSITDAIVDVDFSTGDLILNSILDANGMTDIVIQAIDVAGNAVLSNTFTVTINALNDPPVAVDGDATAYEDFLNNFPAPGVLAFVTDVENDTLTVTEVNGSAVNVAMPITIGSGGELNVAADGSFTFDPKGLYEYLAAGESTTENFTYTVSDGNGGTDTATVTITIHGVNDPPTVSAAVTTMATEDDSNFSLDLLTNASDVDTTDMLNVDSLMLTGGDDSGVTVNGNQLDIDPSAYNYLAFGESAVITYSYNVIDGEGGVVAQTAMITITGVNDSPAVSAAVSTMATEDDANFSLDLLTNATDVDQSDTLSVLNLMQTNAGDIGGITMDTASSWTIDPSYYNDLAFDESEVITYSYDVSDGNGGTVSQTLTITISGVNDAPVAQADGFSTGEDTVLVGGDVFADNGNGADSDDDLSDSFTVTGISEGMTSGTVGDPFVLSSGATVTLTSGGNFDYNPVGAFDFLAVGETATDEFTYTISDGNGGTDTATVTITITGVNDPVMAADDGVTTTKDTPLNFDVRLDNGNGPDTDADASDTLSVIEITDPVLGTTTATVGMEIPLESGATVTLQADGTLVYDPNGMFPDLFEPTDFDTDIFTYKITDGDTTDTATVTVTVTGSNELLMLTDVPLENISRDGLTPETIDLDLHFNDPDVGDTVTYMVEAHVEGGMAGDALPANFWANVAISGSDLNITYTDYDSEQVRLPLVITVTAHSDDTLSDDVTSTFTLTPVPQATVDIRLIARDVESSGRDFTSFRAELNFGTVVLDEFGGARFQLVNGLQDLTYSIYLGDYDLDVDGTANGDSTDDLKELRIIDTTNDDVLFTIFSNSSAHDNPTIDSVNDILTGTWTLGEGLSSAIIDKLYDGVLAVEVIENTGGAGTHSIASGGNIVVSPEVADVTDLPSSISQVAVGDQYVVEIWISDQLAQVLAGQSTTTAGLSSILMDMMWDVADTSLVEDLFTIDTSAFGFLTTVLDVDAPGGVLNDISATSVLPDLVSNGYGRVGYAVFSADNVADDVDFMIDTTDLISGDDGVNRDKTIDFSQLSITNTTVDQVTPSEFFIQTDLSNLSVSGTITIDGQEINLLPQSAGLNSPSVSGRLDVLLDDVNDPGTIQIVDSYIEVNPSGLARPDRGGTLDYSSLDLADFGLIGDQTFEITVPLSGTFDAEISLAIRDAIAQVISSRQVLDGSGNFDISEDWLLENGLLDSMVSVPSEGNGVFTTNSESTADETMSFFDPLTMAPTGLAAWSQANLTLVSPGIFELLIPISRRIEFTTEDGNDVVLNLVGSATARFNVNQDETDEAGDTLATAEVTGLTSAAPGTQVYQGIIGNNTVIADPLLDVDMFEIQLDAGDSVIVDIDANMFETGLDSVVRIFDSLGNQVAYSDNALAPDEFLVDQLAFPFDSYVSFTASSTGTYYIGVSAYNDSDDPSTYDPTNTAGRPTGVDPADVGSYDLTITVQEGVAPLHGTQAIEIDTTLDEGTTIDLVVVRTQTELDAFAQTTGLPASDTWIDEWSSFWVEVYVETADARGITDAAVDLNYNTNFFSATEIEFSRAFADSGQAVIDDTTGVVTGLSGTANYEKAGNGNKTLLARVKFESLAQDDVSIDFEDKFIGPHALGLSLSNVNVNLTNGSDTTLIVGDAPETDLWAIAYDVNDDDTINARDLVVLVTIYGQNVLDSDSPYVWALDADKSGTVDNRDLRYFVSNYGIQKGGDKDVVYPANFLQRWYGKTTDITGDSSIDQVMDEALGIWQDALGLAEPLDIQLVITNLGGTQLGEGQITGVDSEGRPVSGIVTLDDNAAGLGWYSDLDSSAFSDTDLEGGVAYTADAGSDAAGHYDLLTVLLHEIGHVLGFTETYAPFESFVQSGVGGTLSFVGSGFEATLTDDGLHLDDTVHAGDVMNATLDPGVRKLPSILDALILQSAHEAAASGSFEILVGVNAPLMANLPADEQLVAGNEPLMALESNTVVLSSNVTELNESVLPQFNLTRTQLNLNSSTLNQDELDLTVLEGLNDEQVGNLRLNGLSIVDSREYSPNSDAGQTETDSDLLGLTQEFDAEFDDVFSDWAGPIL
jgi:VCBS repeat-containing protein